MRDNQIDDAQAIAKIGQRECTDLRHDGVLDSLAASAKCSNPKIIEAYKRVGFPYMDLIQQYAEKRLFIMQERDDKKIPESRVNKELNENLDYLRAEAHIRDSGI